MPVYLVKSPAGEKLVQADLKSVAVNHVIRQSVKAEPVTAEALLTYLNKGLTVEKAEPKTTKEENTDDA